MTEPHPEFRRHQRAASEALISAAQVQGFEEVVRSLDEAVSLSHHAFDAAATKRQRILAQGLRHTAETMRLYIDNSREGMAL